MNFWQFAAENPGWVTAWLVIVALAIPSVSYSRTSGTKKADKPEEPPR